MFQRLSQSVGFKYQFDPNTKIAEIDMPNNQELNYIIEKIDEYILDIEIICNNRLLQQ